MAQASLPFSSGGYSIRPLKGKKIKPAALTAGSTVYFPDTCFSEVGTIRQLLPEEKGSGCRRYLAKDPISHLRVAIPREKRGIKEFDDEEFLTRKTDEENEELTGLKKTFLGKNIEKNFEN